MSFDTPRRTSPSSTPSPILQLYVSHKVKQKNYSNPLNFLSPSLMLCGVHLLGKKKTHTPSREIWAIGAMWTFLTTFLIIQQLNNSITETSNPFFFSLQRFKGSTIRISTYLSLFFFFVNLPWDCPLCAYRKEGVLYNSISDIFDIKYFIRISKGL